MIDIDDCATCPSACNSGEKKGEYECLSILTGGTQGTYYALADIITQETGIKTTAEVSQASAANMTALKDGGAEIAFVQTDLAYYDGSMILQKVKRQMGT